MAEQTMVALLWQQGDARGTLNLPASTKVEDLKLCLNASDCAAVMFDMVIIEVRKGGFEIPRPTLTSTLLQLVVTGTAWVVRSEVVLAARWRIQLCWSSSRESVLCLCSVGRSCSGGRHI